MWKKIGVCPAWQCDERLWHAGLSEDGTKCFVAGFEDNVFIVWDTSGHRVVWRDDGTNGDSPIQPLEQWIDHDGYITLESGEGSGRYRIFGLELSYAKVESAVLHQLLEGSAKKGTFHVRDLRTNAIICELTLTLFQAIGPSLRFRTMTQ
jgi:WD40 repeat protein